jgi:hypothetical protein
MNGFITIFNSCLKALFQYWIESTALGGKRKGTTVPQQGIYE